MTALTKGRNTPVRAGEQFEDPVAAGETIYEGALVALDASGNAVPGSTATTLTARGRALEQADNAGGSAGDIDVTVEAGVFRWANSSGDPIDRTHIGGTAYIEDDQTVSATDGGSTQSEAGRIVDLDDDGVWVATGTP